MLHGAFYAMIPVLIVYVFLAHKKPLTRLAWIFVLLIFLFFFGQSLLSQIPQAQARLDQRRANDHQGNLRKDGALDPASILPSVKGNYLKGT